MFRNKIINEIKNIKDIPTMFRVALEIERLAQDINSSASQISQIIKLDPALTAKVLAVANSAAYASTHKISDLNQVISRLGFPTIRKIALSIAVMNTFKSKYIDYSKFWIHSITVGYTAMYIHKLSQPMRKNEEVYTAGILHDIGILILDQYFPDLYRKVFDIAAKKKADLQFVEQKILGIDHAEVGQILFENWKLPQSIVEVIRYHHSPQKSTNELYNSRIVYLANFICNNRGIDNGTGFFPESFYDDIWEDLNLPIDDIQNIIDDVQKDTDLAKDLLKLGGL